MTVFVIVDVKVTDDSWIPDYAAKVHDIVHKHGGKYFARGANITNVEGEPLDTTLIALLQFPNIEAASAFMEDPDYVPYRDARRAGSVSKLNAIDDTDVAGTIPYLAKAE